jgi:predicted enzyme related to lactoylglutathione lyase
MENNRFRTHGAFSWLELLTPDPKAAGQFYTKLLGWKLQENAMGMPYTAIEVQGEAMGGMMKTPAQGPDMPPQWGIYITVNDVDETARLARQLGGAVHREPADIPGVGRFAVLADPQGATFCVIAYRAM